MQDTTAKAPAQGTKSNEEQSEAANKPAPAYIVDKVLVEWAKAYLERGFVPVPLNAAGIPQLEWSIYFGSGAKPTADEIECWPQWYTSWQGIGLVMGDGYAALDIDDPAAFGDLPQDTLLSKTRSGYHAIYKAPDDAALRITVPKEQDSAIPGTDYLGGKHLVTVAPSLSRKDGVTPYTWLNDLEPAPLPEWVCDRVRAHVEKNRVEPKEKGAAGSDSVDYGDDPISWGKAVERFAFRPEGDRHGRLVILAKAARNAGVPKGRARAELHAACLANGLIADDTKEGKDGEAQFRHDFAGGWVYGAEPKPAASRFKTYEDLLKLPAPKALITMPGHTCMVPEGVTTLFGPKGEGKTWVAVDWACSLARVVNPDEPALHHMKVVYIFTEGSAAAFGQRVRANVDAYGPLEPGAFIIHDSAVNLSDPKAVGAFIAATLAGPGKPGLVIVDTLARCFGGGDENKPRDMNAFVAGVDRLKDELGANVWVLHHTGKNTAAGSRGSTALPAAADCEIYLHAVGGNIHLDCEKMRNAPEWGTIACRLLTRPDADVPVVEWLGPVDPRDTDDSEAVSDAGEQILAILEGLAGKGLRSKDLREACAEKGISERTFYRARRKLVEGGALERIGKSYFKTK